MLLAMSSVDLVHHAYAALVSSATASRRTDRTLQHTTEVVEHCASVPSLIMGETVENLSADLDTYSFKQPLGVCAGIAPFNFPAMIPLWMFPLATTCGNTYVLKPSEMDPGCTMVCTPSTTTTILCLDSTCLTLLHTHVFAAAPCGARTGGWSA